MAEISQQERKLLQKRVDETGILDLSFRDLTKIPEFVWRLTRLRRLRLDHNRIGGKVVVPKDATLPLIQEIDLSFNRIESIPDTFERFNGPDFELLDLSHNALTDLPDELSVFLFGSELQIAGYSRYNRGISAMVKNINNRQWHGGKKVPRQPEFRFVKAGGGRYVKMLIKREVVPKVEGSSFRISFLGNVELERNLREALGMQPDKPFNAFDLNDFLLSRAEDKEEMDETVERPGFLEEKPKDKYRDKKLREKTAQKAIDRERRAKGAERVLAIE